MRYRKRLLVVASLLATLIFLLTGCLTPQPEADVGDERAIAPDFTLADLEGKTVSLGSLGGKPLLLNFWASWCGPCRMEMAFIEAVYQEKAEDIHVLAVNIEESRFTVQGFMEAEGLTFPVALDSEGRVSAKYGVRYLPTTFFIDKAGLIRQAKFGPFRDKAEILAGLESIG